MCHIDIHAVAVYRNGVEQFAINVINGYGVHHGVVVLDGDDVVRWIREQLGVVSNEVVDAVTFRCEMDGLSRKTRFSICAIGNEVGIVFCTKLKVAEGVWIRRYSNIGVVCIACFLVGKCPLGGRTRCLVPGKSSGCT